MAQKVFQRVSDNTPVTLDVTESAVSDKNNIIAFKANGKHYHVRKHRHHAHHFAAAKSAIMGGVPTGAMIGGRGGPKAMLKGAAVGSLLFYLGELAYEETQEHLKNLKQGQSIQFCYVDDGGTEVYWAPVSA